jgi:sec-independent protein translocase protein TatC
MTGDQNTDAQMPLGDHLDELRRRLFKCVVVFIIVVAVCLYFQDYLMAVVTRPHVWAMKKVSVRRVKKRREDLLKKKPFENIRKKLAASEKRAAEKGKLGPLLDKIPEPQAARIREQIEAFTCAEKELRETLEKHIALYEARRQIELALLELKENGADLDAETEKTLLEWADYASGTPAAFREFHRVLDEERDLDRRAQSFQKLRVLKYQESFITYLKISIICALIFTGPFIIYQIWMFIALGLYRQERRTFYIFGPFSILLFGSGVCFGYFVLIRLGLKFLAGYGNPDLIENNITLGFYLSLFVLLTFLVGVVFELPLVMYVLARIGLVAPRTFARSRRYFIVGSFILAALFTPPDIITQVLLAIPMLFLYEFGIILAKIAVKPKEEAAEKTPDSK